MSLPAEFWDDDEGGVRPELDYATLELRALAYANKVNHPFDWIITYSPADAKTSQAAAAFVVRTR